MDSFTRATQHLAIPEYPMRESLTSHSNFDCLRGVAVADQHCDLSLCIDDIVNEPYGFITYDSFQPMNSTT